jgi:hypothetical protein
MKMANRISKKTGADAGILEHTLRLLGTSPIDKLAQGLRLGRIGRHLKVTRL